MEPKVAGILFVWIGVNSRVGWSRLISWVAHTFPPTHRPVCLWPSIRVCLDKHPMSMRNSWNFVSKSSIVYERVIKVHRKNVRSRDKVSPGDLDWPILCRYDRRTRETWIVTVIRQSSISVNRCLTKCSVRQYLLLSFYHIDNILFADNLPKTIFIDFRGSHHVNFSWNFLGEHVWS